MPKGYLLKLKKVPSEMLELIDRLKNSKIKYVSYYDFCLENLKEKMCAEYTVYTDFDGKCVVEWFVTDKDAVIILISVGAAITSDGANWKKRVRRNTE